MIFTPFKGYTAIQGLGNIAKAESYVVPQMKDYSINIPMSRPDTSYPQYTKGLGNIEVTQLDPESITPIIEVPSNTKIYSNTSSIMSNGVIHLYDKGKFNSFTGKRGNKAERNNNPGNITGVSGKLLYGASAIAHNSFGDKGDQAQLVYSTPEAGWSAMAKLVQEKYSSKPIKDAFSKWQSNQKVWDKMKKELISKGIDINKKFSELSDNQKRILLIQRARHEGWTGPIPKFNI